MLVLLDFDTIESVLLLCFVVHKIWLQSYKMKQAKTRFHEGMMQSLLPTNELSSAGALLIGSIRLGSCASTLLHSNVCFVMYRLVLTSC